MRERVLKPDDRRGHRPNVFLGLGDVLLLAPRGVGEGARVVLGEAFDRAGVTAPDGRGAGRPRRLIIGDAGLLGRRNRAPRRRGCRGADRPAPQGTERRPERSSTSPRRTRPRVSTCSACCARRRARRRRPARRRRRRSQRLRGDDGVPLLIGTASPTSYTEVVEPSSAPGCGGAQRGHRGPRAVGVGGLGEDAAGALKKAKDEPSRRLLRAIGPAVPIARRGPRPEGLEDLKNRWRGRTLLALGGRTATRTCRRPRQAVLPGSSREGEDRPDRITELERPRSSPWGSVETSRGPTSHGIRDDEDEPQELRDAASAAEVIAGGEYRICGMRS